MSNASDGQPIVWRIFEARLLVFGLGVALPATLLGMVAACVGP